MGQLHALAEGQWYLQQDPAWETLRSEEFRDGIYPDLPWFLQDMRPRGFLGRMLARQVASELGTPEDPRDWGSDDIVHFLLVLGSDLSGSFVLGQRALGAAQSDIMNGRKVIDCASREQAYPALADAVTGGKISGSSAAGEQPKFTVRVRADNADIYDVIVKFSGRGGRPEDRRWADLLVAEDVANSILIEAGIPCASTEILQGEGRCFLESVRFDRTVASGRVGVVTLEAFDAAFFGESATRWTDAAGRCRRANWLSDEDATRLETVWWFGNLIGNTDMHYGNASLFLKADRPLSLAPVYDMVPMLYRPGIEGHLPTEPISPIPPPPEALSVWTEAAVRAEKFWSRLAGHDRVSPSFSDISASCADVVARMRSRFVQP